MYLTKANYVNYIEPRLNKDHEADVVKDKAATVLYYWNTYLEEGWQPGDLGRLERLAREWTMWSQFNTQMPVFSYDGSKWQGPSFTDSGGASQVARIAPLGLTHVVLTTTPWGSNWTAFTRVL